MSPLIWVILGVFLIQGCMPTHQPFKPTWLYVPDRNFEYGFEPLGGNTADEETKKDTNTETAEAAVLKKEKTSLFSEHSANRVVGEFESHGEGLAAMLRKEKENINLQLGITAIEVILLIDNRCKEGAVKLRCISATKDTRYFEIPSMNGYVLRMSASFSNPTLSANVRWVCEFESLAMEKRVIMDVFGGQAPREKVNFYEIRHDGVVRLDAKTTDVYKKQPKGKWQSE